MIDKDEFQSFAKGLPTCDEFDLRNKASRLYYFLYHFLTNLVPDDHHVPANGGVHAQLVDILSKGFLSNPNKLKYIKLSVLLRKCKDIRVLADYKLNNSFDTATLEELEDTIETCVEIVNQLEHAA